MDLRTQPLMKKTFGCEAPLENEKQAENNFARCLIDISDFIANDFEITPNGS